MKTEYFRVGVFTSTHGIKGEINVYPTTQDRARFETLRTLYIDAPGGFIAREVEGVKYFKNMVILKLRGVDRIEDIEKYKGRDLYVSRAEAIPLEEGEHYVADMIGLPVIDESGERLGTLKDVMETGANDVYVVDMGGRELLIPGIPQCILEVDTEKEFIRVHLLDGLLDL